MPIAEAIETKTERVEQQAQGTARQKVRPHIAYLEFLKSEGLLELAIEGKLPKPVEKAAKLYVIGSLREKYGKEAVPVTEVNGEMMVAVSEEDKKDQDEEVNDFLKVYGLVKAFQPFIYKAMPREILKGRRYVIKSGFFFGRGVLIKGLDREHFGCRWDENYGNPLCENFLMRIQRDSLPMRGLFYVAQLLDTKNEALIHESEIGDAIQ